MDHTGRTYVDGGISGTDVETNQVHSCGSRGSLENEHSRRKWSERTLTSLIPQEASGHIIFRFELPPRLQQLFLPEQPPSNLHPRISHHTGRPSLLQALSKPRDLRIQISRDLVTVSLSSVSTFIDEGRDAARFPLEARVEGEVTPWM